MAKVVWYLTKSIPFVVKFIFLATSAECTGPINWPTAVKGLSSAALTSMAWAEHACSASWSFSTSNCCNTGLVTAIMNVMFLEVGNALNSSKLRFKTDCISAFQVGSQLSATFVVHCSVPRGSVLGALKFVTYTEDLPAIIQCFAINHHLYADDTQLSDELSITSIAASISIMVHCVDAVQRLVLCEEA